MTDKSWREIKLGLYFEDGSLRDVRICRFSSTAWETWTAYVNQTFQLKFSSGDSFSVPMDRIDFAIVQKYWADENRASPSVSIDLGGPILKCYFSEESRFENDLAPSEFLSIDAHVKLMDYMKQLAVLFHQDVELTVENATSNDEILMIVTQTSVEISAGSSSQISAHNASANDEIRRAKGQGS